MKYVSVVSALLVKDISFNKEGLEVIIPSGTHVKIDIERGIALVGRDHLEVFEDEWKVVLN